LPADEQRRERKRRRRKDDKAMNLATICPKFQKFMVPTICINDPFTWMAFHVKFSVAAARFREAKANGDSGL